MGVSRYVFVQKCKFLWVCMYGCSCLFIHLYFCPLDRFVTFMKVMPILNFTPTAKGVLNPYSTMRMCADISSPRRHMLCIALYTYCFYKYVTPLHMFLYTKWTKWSAAGRLSKQLNLGMEVLSHKGNKVMCLPDMQLKKTNKV